VLPPVNGCPRQGWVSLTARGRQRVQLVLDDFLKRATGFRRHGLADLVKLLGGLAQLLLGSGARYLTKRAGVGYGRGLSAEVVLLHGGAIRCDELTNFLHPCLV